MKVLALFLVAIFVNVQASPAEEKWLVPKADGSSQWMSESALNKLARDEGETENKDDGIVYYLYTRNNPTEPQILKLNDKQALAHSHFSSNYKTWFIVHGWLGDTDSVLTNLIEPLVNQKGEWNNVIFVDWSASALTLNYAKARLRVPKIGKQIAEFIDELHAFGGMSFEKLNVIGHSLGTHVTGFVGKNLKLGRIRTIYGLDPAMPLFSYNKPNERLNSTDAEYVETIHTNGEQLGFLQPIGQAAFYPNWGKTQPGCESDLSGYCSHARCVDFFVEAIELAEDNQFDSVECGDFESIKKKGCLGKSGTIKMYDPNNYQKVNGLYYLPTKAEAPWGEGSF